MTNPISIDGPVFVIYHSHQIQEFKSLPKQVGYNYN